MTYTTSGQDHLFLPSEIAVRDINQYVTSSNLTGVEIYKSLVAIGKYVMFTWIPSHIGIHGNTVVDGEAKNAWDDPVSNCSIPYTDIKPCIVKYILKRWQDSWDQQIHHIHRRMC
jgi:hypothetical protein